MTPRSTSDLAPLLQSFFTDKLMRQRQASPNTIAASAGEPSDSYKPTPPRARREPWAYPSTTPARGSTSNGGRRGVDRWRTTRSPRCVIDGRIDESEGDVVPGSAHSADPVVEFAQEVTEAAAAVVGDVE
jgi:hypothetical protein